MVLLFTETWVPFPAPTWRCTPLVTPVPGAPVSFFDLYGLLHECGVHTYILSHTHTHE